SCVVPVEGTAPAFSLSDRGLFAIAIGYLPIINAERTRRHIVATGREQRWEITSTRSVSSGGTPPALTANSAPSGLYWSPAIVGPATAEAAWSLRPYRGRARRYPRSDLGPGRRTERATLRGQRASERSRGRSAPPRHPGVALRS